MIAVIVENELEIQGPPQANEQQPGHYCGQFLEFLNTLEVWSGSGSGSIPDPGIRESITQGRWIR